MWVSKDTSTAYTLIHNATVGEGWKSNNSSEQVWKTQDAKLNIHTDEQKPKDQAAAQSFPCCEKTNGVVDNWLNIIVV